MVREFSGKCETCLKRHTCGQEYLYPECYEEDKRRYDIVGFKVPSHKSRLYKMWLTENQLLKAVSEALAKGCNVMSIREVVKE